MNSTRSKYRSRDIATSVIALSISYQRDSLLARGMGLEHLRELLIRLARMILRRGACLAYGGHWRESEDNFMFDLLRLIAAEQEDNTSGGQDAGTQIGRLYNYSAWPHYLDVTPRIEAQWINSCRIVRITQQLAGIPDPDIVPDAEFQKDAPRVAFNSATTLSAMRRLSMQGMSLDIPDVPGSEKVPPVVARILLGGKIDDYSGFMPGILEEALVTMRMARPLYIMGGFGGAAEVLARALLAPGAGRPPELTQDWHIERNGALAKLVQGSHDFAMPQGAKSTGALLDELFKLVLRARQDLPGTLGTGLTDEDTRELLTTRNLGTAVRLVRAGLTQQNKLTVLPG